MTAAADLSAKGFMLLCCSKVCYNNLMVTRALSLAFDTGLLSFGNEQCSESQFWISTSRSLTCWRTCDACCNCCCSSWPPQLTATPVWCPTAVRALLQACSQQPTYQQGGWTSLVSAACSSSSSSQSQQQRPQQQQRTRMIRSMQQLAGPDDARSGR